jgi:hypothetical protein
VQPGWYPDRRGAPGIAVVTLQPQDDPFYSYTGPLDSVAPGTVLKTRSFKYHLFGFPTLLETTQLLYRSTSQTGKPTVNVTSVIKPPIQFDKTKVISYQSAYDSLNRNDEPWSVPIWLLNSIAWIKQRFAGVPAPENCSSIQKGNPLTPIPTPKPI